jgi:exonuclease III
MVTRVDSRRYFFRLVQNSVFTTARLLRSVEGVCILINNQTCQGVKVKVPAMFEDLEVLCVDLMEVASPVRLILCYIPPPRPDANVKTQIAQTSHLVKCLKWLCDTDVKVIILGDLNLPGINWSNPILAVDSPSCSSIVFNIH